MESEFCVAGMSEAHLVQSHAQNKAKSEQVAPGFVQVCSDYLQVLRTLQPPWAMYQYPTDPCSPDNYLKGTYTEQAAAVCVFNLLLNMSEQSDSAFPRNFGAVFCLIMHITEQTLNTADSPWATHLTTESIRLVRHGLSL